MQNLKYLKNHPGVELRGFDRKIAVFGIYCGLHFDKRWVPYEYNSYESFRRMHGEKRFQFRLFLGFDAFKKIFEISNFEHNSSIFIRFLFPCRCEELLNSYIRALSKLLNKKENIRYASKVIIITKLKDRKGEKYKRDLKNASTHPDFKELLKVNNVMIINSELHFVLYPRYRKPTTMINPKHEFNEKIDKIKAWFLDLRICTYEGCLQEEFSKEKFYPGFSDEDWTASTIGNLYADVVNPALGIILNHINFFGGPKRRTGSEVDVKRISKFFTKKNMPHIVIPDGQMKHDNAIFEMLQKENLNDLKYIVFFIMSHGKEGDIILSGDGDYSVYERIEKIKKNKSLKDIKKLFFIIACRGEINPEWEPIVPMETGETDASQLDENSVVVHSVRKGYISLRTDNGAVFIQHLYSIISEEVDELSIDDMGTKLNEKFKKCPYYQDYELDRPFDYVKKEKTNINLTVESASISKLKSFCPQINNWKIFETNDKFYRIHSKLASSNEYRRHTI